MVGRPDPLLESLAVPEGVLHAGPAGAGHFGIPVIAQSELAFYRYRDSDSVSGKAVALLRHGFGQHAVHRPRAGQDTRVKDDR